MPPLKTPFFGSAYASRSTNLADQRCVNLYPEIVETRSGKNVGAFYGTPGLVLKTTCGAGPVQKQHVFAGTLYAISGNQIYSVSPGFAATLIGSIDSSSPAPAIIDNGNQMAIFTGTSGYLLPGGFPLDTGDITSGGAEYEVGDEIYLSPNGGVTSSTAILLVTEVGPYRLTGGFIEDAGQTYSAGDTVTLAAVGGTQLSPAEIEILSVMALTLAGGAIGDAGGTYNPGDNITLLGVGGVTISPATIQVTTTSAMSVTGFTVTDPGQFSVAPSSFSQASTSGSGTGFVLSSPTFGSGEVISFEILNAGTFAVPPTGFTQASTSGSGTGFTLGTLSFTSGNVTAFTVQQAGAFPVPPASFGQASTTGSGQGFILSDPVFKNFLAVVPITLPFLPNGQPISACQADGFGLINQPGTSVMWQSDELDLSVWRGLNFASADGDPDPIVALAQQHREIFVIKEVDIEIWTNVGSPGFVFARLTNIFIQAGAAAINSGAKVGETLVWLSRNSQGQGVVVQLQGYNPARVSTHAIEHAIQEYSTISDAIGMSYQQEGHQFYMLTFPTGNATWVYDATASAQAGMPMWHQRAAFLNGQFGRHWANCAVAAYGLNLVGDYRNGNIYQLDLDQQLDNGTQRKWLRSWRALPQPSLDPVRFSELSIDMQTGIGVPDGAAPEVELRWSDDGGHNWANQVMTAAGPPGATAIRVRFDRLGSTRRNSGLDRIFELSSADQFPAALIGADLR